MSEFFPPDVRVSIEGDPTSQVLGVARTALFKTLQRAAVGGASHLTSRFVVNGAVIEASVAGPITSVSIVAPPGPSSPEPVLPPPVDYVPASGLPAFGMLTGWVRSTDPFEWKPTSYTATAYRLAATWQALPRLEVNAAAMQETKPSAYSGAMKRWVQAILGMGIITDESPLYLTGAAPAVATRAIPLTYTGYFQQTHGIVKTGTKNHWLVRVTSGGVYAMPLPLLASTTSARYRARIVLNGDVGTLRVLDEFGGLPSGEDFPATQLELDTLVASGHIVCLVAAAQMAEVYGLLGVRTSSGWAFSENTGEAHNTVYRVVDEAGNALVAPSTTPGARNYCQFEHWSLDIALSEHDVRNLAVDLPVGAGTAVLTRVYAGSVDPTGLQGFKINALYEDVASAFGYGRLEYPAFDFYNQTDYPAARWGAVVHVYFDEDRLIRVRWVPRHKFANIDGVGPMEYSTWGAVLTAHGVSGYPLYYDFRHVARQPSWSGVTYSPAAFVSQLHDPRGYRQETGGYVAPWPPVDYDTYFTSAGDPSWGWNEYTGAAPAPAVQEYGGAGGQSFQSDQVVALARVREGYCAHCASGTYLDQLGTSQMAVRDLITEGAAQFFAGAAAHALEIEDRPASTYPSYRTASEGAYISSGYLLLNAYSTFHQGEWVSHFDNARLGSLAFSAAFEATRTEGVTGMISYRGNPNYRYNRIELPGGMTEVTPTTVNWTGSHYAH